MHLAIFLIDILTLIVLVVLGARVAYPKLFGIEETPPAPAVAPSPAAAPSSTAGMAPAPGRTGLLGCLCDVIWKALRPDFAGFNADRATTQTLNLLMAAMLVFGLVITVWAIGAGGMRTAFLYTAQPDGVADGLSKGWILAAGSGGWQTGLFFVGMLLLQVARAVGGVLVICLAAGLAGAMLGFIFGIPRPISAPETQPTGGGGGTASAAAAAQARQPSAAWRLSTNLTQISDWLTKIIVGVGLVEIRRAWVRLQYLFVGAADWLFEKRHGSPVLLGSVMIGGAVIGFLFSYLYAQLIVSRLVAAVDSGLAQAPPLAARQILAGVQSFREGLAPRISRSGRAPEPTDQPTLDQVAAALQYNRIRFEDMIADPGVTDQEVLNWARARAILNDYRDAAQGYIYLLGFAHGASQV